MKQNKHLVLTLALLLAWSGERSIAQAMETFSFTNLNFAIPDGDWSGLSDRRSVSSSILRLHTLRVRLHIVGEFNGDLYCYLRHTTSAATNFCVLLNRPGRSLALPEGCADGGLDVIFDDLASSGNIHNYRAVTNPPSGAPLTGAWQPDGRHSGPSAVLDTTPATTTLGSFNGTDVNGQWTLFVADVDSGATNLLAGWELEVTGAERPPVTWAVPADIVYGTALSVIQLNATSTVPGTFAYSPPANTVLNAGDAQTLTATFTPADSINYLAVTSSVSINVLKKSLTITALNASKVYGESLPALGVSYSGFVNGETTNNLTACAAVTTTATAASPVGSYAIRASGAAGSNYTFSYNEGTLTIAKAGAAGSFGVSPNPGLPGMPVVFTYVLNAVAPGAGTPSGAVQFRLDGAPAGPPVTLSLGVASYSISTLSVGTHTATAEYAGDSNFFGATNSLAPTLLVNTPPVAGPDTIVRYGTNDVKLSIASLLTNDHDPDGDPVAFLSASSPGTNGGAITRDGNWLTYTPPAGSTNGDSFTYSISDGRGAPVIGPVQIAAWTDTAPSPNLLVQDLGNGSLLIEFNGIPGFRYRIEYCENVHVGNWQELGAAVADSFGQFQFVDTPPTAAPARFYRSVYP